MAVRSRTLWGPVALAAGAGLTVVYTVPNDRTAIIHTVVVSNPNAIATTSQMRFTLSGVSGIVRPTFNVAGNARDVDSSWYALEDGDQVRFNCGAGAGIEVYGFGSLLLGDPA